MTCTQCADTGQYAWFDSLNERETQVICLCSAGTALLRKTALSRVATHGHVSSGEPLATIATCRIVEDELVRAGLIERATLVIAGGDVVEIDRWRLTEKGRAQ
jgi:hypothetical protein